MSSMTDTETTKLRIAWADGEAVEANSAAELDARLDELDRRARENDYPVIVDLVHSRGPVVTVGVGSDVSVLNYSASEDPPYFTSRNPESDQDGTVVFYYFGASSEFNADNVVPMSAAREAARRFFADGQRPDNLDWQQD